VFARAIIVGDMDTRMSFKNTAAVGGRVPGRSGPVMPGAGPQKSRLSAEEFSRLFEEHWRLLWCASAAVLGDRSNAQDCVQQAAVIGLERLEMFDPGTSFAAWMTQIVRHVSMNEARKQRRRRTSSVENETLDAHAGTSGGIESDQGVTSRGTLTLDQSSFDDELAGALQGLDETARSCLLLRVVTDLPYREIGLALGIPEGTAASHVHRARRALRERLSDSAGRGAGERSSQ
jgi:RNA polymerase sigma-70 factor (ECF subfamily)